MTTQESNTTLTKPTDFSYPKAHHLLTPNHFSHVFGKPDRKIHASHIMAFIRSSELEHPRLGLAITKKKVPTAVARNLLKRLTRERFRLSSHDLQKTDIVFIAKRPIKGLSNAELNQQIEQIFNKIKLK